VTFALFAAQNLTGASHFKALGDGRSGFGLASFAGHGSGFLGLAGPNARFFVKLMRVFFESPSLKKLN
jgi:hypothetical protein